MSVGSVSASDEIITPGTFVQIAEKCLPSVVAVYVKADIRDQMNEMREKMKPFGDDLLEDPRLKEFFKQFDQDGEGAPGEGDPNAPSPHDEEMFETRASGSGVILSEDGYIVTNLHIVAGSKPGSVSVVLNDDTEIPGDKVEIVATDEYIDIAVLKVDAGDAKLQPIAWGDSEAMRIGDFVVAIGNPLDLRGSVSQGIISAKARKIYKVDIEHLIQTDAMINPGNSGGALVNLKGELIGINMAIATNSGFFQGIGFAIPAKDARFVTDQVMKEGRVKRGYIGIEMWPLDDDMWDAMGITDKKKRHGITVTNVVPGAPADKAGIKPYDIITHVDTSKIEETRDILAAIASKAVGDTANLSVLRDDGTGLKELQLTMNVTERPSDEELMRQRTETRLPVREEPAPESSIEHLGLFLTPYDDGETKGLEIERIVAGSPASQSKSGLMPGDILLEVNRTPVASIEDYKQALKKNVGEKPHLVSFLQQGRRSFGAIEKAAPKKKSEE